MRMTDCDLDVDAVVSHPMTVAEPEPEWTRPRDAGTIPMQLYDFYRVANCFSFAAEPPFLQDADKLLFPYLKNVASEMRDTFECLPELLTELRRAHGDEYSPIKEARGLPWDPQGIRRSRRAFKALVIELGGLLDQFSELASLFFHGRGGLSLGRAMFSQLQAHIRENPASAGSVISSPKEIAFESLLVALRVHIAATGPEEDWLDYFARLRNKSAHIGPHTLHTAGLRGGGDSVEMFTFMPNTWPRMAEQFAAVGPRTSSNPHAMRDWLLDSYIQQDLVQYSEALASRIKTMIGDGLEALRSTYVQFQSFSPDPDAITSLKSQQSKRFAFKYFT